MLRKPATLPYLDAKDIGAADFYFGINATFRFIERRFSKEGLCRYWQEMGRNYFRPVTENWRVGGFAAVAKYWREFFDAEPGAEVEVLEENERVTLNVRRCPAITHLRANGRVIVRDYCQHCYFVSDTMGERADVTVRISGGNGSCRQEFIRRERAMPQDFDRIAPCL